MEKNMTQGSPWKHLLMFSLPILGGMLLQLLYTTVDGIVVGNFVSETALGAMNSATSYSNVLLAIATGLSTGCGIVIAQLFGAGNREGVRRCISTMLILMLGLGLVITIVGELTAELMLTKVLGVPEDIIHYSMTYMRIYFIGMVFQFAYNAFAAELRALGDSKATMLFLLISSAANIIFDLVFVIAFHWDVAGVAIGTVLSQGISAVVSLIYIRKKHPLLALKVKEMTFDGQQCKMILKLGIPVMLQTIISSAGSMAIQRLINSFGSSTMAGVAAAAKVESFAVMPSIAFAAGMSTYVGQNIGAGDLKRVWKGYWSGLIMGCSLCCVLSLILIIFATPLTAMFGCSGDSLTFGVQYLKFMACVLPIMMVLFTSRGLLQGAGDVTTCTIITFATLAMRIVVAYWMAGWPSIGRKTIYICMGIDFVVGALMYVVRLASGKWKQKALVKAETEK